MKYWFILFFSFSLSCNYSPEMDWGFLDEFDYLEEDSRWELTSHNSSFCLPINDSGRNSLHLAAIFGDYKTASEIE